MQRHEILPNILSLKLNSIGPKPDLNSAIYKPKLLFEYSLSDQTDVIRWLRASIFIFKRPNLFFYGK
jgi:hypothetical protein